MDAIPAEQLLPPRRAGVMLLALLALAAVLCAASVALPHNPYIRFQQFASGDFSRVRWVYERIHFDPTPIDVAVIGSSRTEAAISAPKLEMALSAQLGRPVHVANLAVPLEGRDTHYVIAQELMRAHPETRLVLLSLVEPIRRSHPAFRNIADARTVLTQPMWLNYYWLDNAAFLPYRNLSLFFQSRFPALFGMDAQFNAPRYAQQGGTAFDTTKSFRLDNGALVDRESLKDEAVLDRDWGGGARSAPSRLAQLTGADDNIVENGLTAALAQQLHARCTGLVLVHMPIYRADNSAIDIATNERAAPILLTPPSIGDSWQDFSDPGHLRRSGIDKVTDWLPGALTPYLGPLERKGC